MHTVHGFASAVYNVEEGKRLDTVFALNVKGTTTLPLAVLGMITSEKGSASECTHLMCFINDC